MAKEKKRAEFMPWAALNEFMVDSYRVKVVREAMLNMQRVGGKPRGIIQQQIRKTAKVPGFRNAAKAPIQVQIQPAAEVFKKEDDMVKAVLAIWAEVNAELRQQVYDFLTAREWEVLPPETDRGVQPGWIHKWPVMDDMHTLGEAFIDGREDVTMDDACLMICWVSGRLPVEMPDEDEESEGDEETEGEEASAGEAAEQGEGE